MLEYLVAFAVIVLLYYYFQKKKSPKGKTGNLRREYIRRAGLPPATAHEHIDSYIRRLQEKHPGRSEEWCLEKMLFDLERDRS